MNHSNVFILLVISLVSCHRYKIQAMDFQCLVKPKLLLKECVLLRGQQPCAVIVSVRHDLGLNLGFGLADEVVNVPTIPSGV